MKKLLLLPVLLLLAAFAFAQDDDQPKTNIPPNQFASAVKPYLGTFNGLECQKGGVYGLQFTITQDKPTDFPAVTLTQVQNISGKLETVSNAFHIMGLFSKDKNGEAVTLLYVTNGSVLAVLVPLNGKLLGLAVSEGNPKGNPIVFAPASGTLPDFVKTNSNICSSDQSVRRKFFGLPEPDDGDSRPTSKN